MYTTLEHFLKYVTFNTRSAQDAHQTPSTMGQRVLALELVKELTERGLSDVTITPQAYVTATLPSNSNKKLPAIGFITHMDTATETSGKDVKARIVKNYDGDDIILNQELKIALSPRDFPDLLNCKGQDLVVTDGTTLLGADDKAGMAEVMGAVDWMLEHPDFEHGDVKIAFTPDEEVGEGARGLDLDKFGADFAYTLDGGPLGEVSYETFNAAQAIVTIIGRSVHPGTAKGLMLSAIMLGHELLSKFPLNETPATTEGYEGYYHCTEFTGTVESAKLRFILRDHDHLKFEARKSFMKEIVQQMRDKYGSERFKLELKDQYYNMADKLVSHMEVVNLILDAMTELDIAPNIFPLRGGTDGAALTWRGLLTPNFFSGGYNYHGPFEFIPVQSMEKGTAMVLKILELSAKRSE